MEIKIMFIVLMAIWFIFGLMYEIPMEVSLNTKYCALGCLVGGTADLSLKFNSDRNIQSVYLTSEAIEEKITKNYEASAAEDLIPVRFKSTVGEGNYPINVHVNFDKTLLDLIDWTQIIGGFINWPATTSSVQLKYPDIRTKLTELKKDQQEFTFTINVNNEDAKDFNCSLQLLSDKGAKVEHRDLSCDESEDTQTSCSSQMAEIKTGNAHPCCTSIQAKANTESRTTFTYYPVCVIDGVKVPIKKQGVSINSYTWDHSGPIFKFP